MNEKITHQQLEERTYGLEKIRKNLEEQAQLLLQRVKEVDSDHVDLTVAAIETQSILYAVLNLKGALNNL